MESATKNKQSFETINAMAAKAFDGMQAVKVTELKEGFFNVAYSVTLSDGEEVILKIAPPPHSLFMTHEKNIMYAEVECMKLVKSRTNVPVAEVLSYDRSHTLCSSDYFFMSKIDGRSLNTISDELSDEEKAEIHYQIGELNSAINRITGEKFGYFAQEDKQGDNWYSVFSSIISDAVHDAKAMKIDIGVEYGAIRELLAKFQPSFKEVTVPKLIHWDLWEGNVFIKDKKITGFIDFERCLWADELMEVGLRSHNQDKNFLKGYGMETLTDTQQVRIKWYDLYLFLIMSLECDYRKYPNYEQLKWAKDRIKETIELLKMMIL